jgi:murein DD-endopeptidase MepM/ murein hydrolase activator NlpD
VAYKSSDTNDPRKEVARVQTETDGTFKLLIYSTDEDNIVDENANGIADELEETYDIVVTKPGYLSYTVTDIEIIEEQETMLDEYNLIAGDTVETGEIELDDLVALNDNVGTTITDENKEDKALYDLNEDGIIDKEDRNILKANYGKQAETVAWVNPASAIMMTSLEDDDIEIKSSKKVGSQTVENAQNNADSSTENEQNVENATFTLPMKTEYTITSEYGYRTHPTTGEYKKHTGIDISGVWHTEIYSVADGEVVDAGVDESFGNYVEIKHIVNGEEIYSFYAHLSRIDVTVGQTVAQGEQIGLEGGAESDENHGNSTGHHLHFEIRTASGYGNDVDPTEYIKF